MNKNQQNRFTASFMTICQTLGSAPVPACVVDSSGAILYVNRYFAALLHTEEHSLTGSSVDTWLCLTKQGVTWPDLFISQNLSEPAIPATLITNDLTDSPRPVRVDIVKPVQDENDLNILYLTLSEPKDSLVQDSPDTDENKTVTEQKRNTYKDQYEQTEKYRNCCLRLLEQIQNISYFFREKKDINSYLQDLAHVINARRTCVFIFNRQFTRIRFVAEWYQHPALQLGDLLRQLNISDYPWGIEQLKNNEYLIIPETGKLPDKAGNEKKLLQSLSIGSVVALPLWVNFKLNGLVFLDNTDSHLKIQDHELVLLQLYVNLMGIYFHSKKFNKYIRHTELSYRKLIEVSFKAVCIHRDAKIIYVNKNGVALFGAKCPAELIGKNLLEFIHPEDKELLSSPVTGLNQYKIFPLIEQRFIKLTGEIFYVEIASMVINYHGKRAYLSVLRDISERKKIEIALKESEERYRVLFELSPMGNVLTSLDGTILKANNKIAQLLGYSSVGEMLASGKKIRDYVASDYRKIDNENVKELLTNGFMQSREYQLVKTDGNYITVEVDVILIRDATGNPAASIGVLNDISEKKYITQQLLESEERYRLLFELSPMGLVLATADGNILQINKKLADILGSSEPLPLIDKKTTIKEFIVPEQWEMDDKNLEELFATGIMNTREYTLQRRDKTRVYVEVNALLVRDESNVPVAIIGVVNDITEKKKITEKLLESEKRYRSLAEAAQDMIFIIDRQGIVLYVNEYAARALGLTPTEIIGNKQTAFFSSGDSQRQKDSMRRVFVNGEPFYIETETFFSGKKLWIGSWLVPLKNDQGEVYAVQGISRDISERIKTERDLQKSREQYKALVENQGDLIIKMDAEGYLLFASPSFCVSFNKDEQDLLGKRFMSFIHYDNRKSTKQIMKNLLTPPHRCHLECRMLTKEGWRWFSWVETAIIDEEAHVIEIIGVGRDVQEQKDMELQLRAGEERFRELAELLPEIVYEIDLDNKFTFVNQVALTSTGVTREELEKGVYAQDMIVPQDRKRMWENRQRILNGEPTRNSEYLALRRNGSFFPVIGRSTTIKRNGQVIGFRGVMTNITQLKETEAALKASEGKFRDIIERSIDGYYFINKDGIVEYLNKAAMNIFGISQEDLNALNLLNNQKPWLTSEIDVEKRFLLIMSGKPEPGCEIPLRRPDGQEFWINYNGRRVIENGIVKGIKGFFKDITQQKKAEMEIRNSEARYRTLFRNIPFEVFNLGQNGMLRDTNNKFRENWENLVKKKGIKNANDLMLLQIIHQLVINSRKNGQVMQHEYLLHIGEKAINYRMIISPILIEGGDVIGFIGMNIDITDQVLAIEQSKNFAAQLVQMQEDERAHISREIHDSLGQILTALQFEMSAMSISMKTDAALAKRQLAASRHTLSEAMNEARNLCALLRPQLLDDFGLEIALREHIKDFSRRCKIAVEFKCEKFDGSLTNVIELALYRVVQEALNNISKYARASEVSVNLELQDGNIILCIRDNGVGFNIDAIDKNKKIHFGLIGMKERVEYLSGEFMINSEPGQGTFVKAIVPVKYKA